jgi:hypothetical protein
MSNERAQGLETRLELSGVSFYFILFYFILVLLIHYLFATSHYHRFPTPTDDERGLRLISGPGSLFFSSHSHVTTCHVTPNPSHRKRGLRRVSGPWYSFFSQATSSHLAHRVDKRGLRRISGPWYSFFFQATSPPYPRHHT